MAEETVQTQELPLDQVSMSDFKKARSEGKQAVAVEEAPEVKEEVTDDEPKQKTKGGWQNRIDRLTKHIYTLEQQIEGYKKTTETGTKTEEAKVDGEPQRTDYQSDAEYVRALTRWEVKQEIKAEKEAETRKAAEERQKEIVKLYNQKAIQAQARYEDFAEIVGKNEEPIPSTVGQAIVEEMENGPDVAYFLGKHPEVCQQMMEVGPTKAASLAWAISEELAGSTKKEVTDEKDEEEEPVKRKPPTPIRPVTGGTTKTTVPLDKMSMADYKKARLASGRK